MQNALQVFSGFRQASAAAAAVVILSACGGTALDPDELLHLSSETTLQEAMKVMNALGKGQPAKLRRSFSLHDGCFLEVREGGVFRPRTHQVRLVEPQVKITPRQERNLFDVVLLQQSPQEASPMPVLTGLLWFEAHQMAWLLEHVSAVCNDPKRQSQINAQTLRQWPVPRPS